MYTDLSNEDVLRLGIKHMNRNQDLPSELITTLKDRNLYEYLFPDPEPEADD